MKTKHFSPQILVLTLILLMTMAFSACSDKKSDNSVSVAILDRGQTISVEGTSDMTVDELLQKANITVSDSDTVIPQRSGKWSEVGESTIIVRRYAKVQVVNTDTGASSEVELVGGTVKQAVMMAGYDLNSYKTQPGPEEYLTDGMEIRVSQSGDFGSDATQAQPSDGSAVVSDRLTGNETDGYYYVGDNGEVDYGYCDGVQIDGEDWVITNGRATKVESDSDACWFSAAKDIAKCTDTSMSKEEKLKAAFEYIKNNYLEGVRHDPPYQEMDWPVVCANDLFIYGKGDCFSYGAAFAYYGKAIGCDEVYACNSGGHGWAEIEGKFYDPEWDMHNNTYNHFAVSPEDDCDVDYVHALMDGVEWMKIKL